VVSHRRPASYLKLYRIILDQLDPAEIFDRLISFGDNPVMLCWETASDCQSGKTFFHRHLAAQWLEERLGIDAPEVGHPKLDRFAFLRARASRHQISSSRPLNTIGSDNAFIGTKMLIVPIPC
jgi:hypothetical protein